MHKNDHQKIEIGYNTVNILKKSTHTYFK